MKKMLLNLLALALFGGQLFAVQSYTHKGSVDSVYQTPRQKKKLFASVGCNYMNKMVITSPDCFVDPYSTSYFQHDADYIQKLSKKYQKDVLSGKLAPMYLKFISPVVGYGIFATKDIKKDDFIGVYAGDLRYVDWNSKDFKEDVDYAWYYTVDGKDGKKMIIDGKYRGNELRFVNHANNPNTKRIDVVVDGKFYICYVAVRDIAEGSQLTVSYGDGYWSSRQVNPNDVE